MTRPTTTVWAFSADEATAVLFHDWRDLKVSRDTYGSETLSLTVGRNSVLAGLAMGTTIGQEFYGWSLAVKHYKGSELIFRGPVRDVKMVDAGPTTSAWVTLELEGHVQHALRRRLNFTSDNDRCTVSATRPNTTAITLIDNAMGGGTGPVAPTNYPGGELRTDFHGVTYQSGSATGSPAVVNYTVQSGKNLQDIVEELCQLYDMCPVLSRQGAAHYHIDIAYPYEKADLSSSVCLTPLRGTASRFEIAVPYNLVTVARMGGSGSGAAQSEAWASSNTATYGVYEDQITDPGATPAATDLSALLRASTPQYGYAVDCVYTSAAEPFVAYGWRNTVRLYDPTYGYSTDQTIIGYDYEAWNGGRAWRVTWMLREKRASILRLMADRTGLPYGRSAGGRWRDTSG